MHERIPESFWAPHLHLLGVMSDTALGEMLGVSPTTVGRRRKEEGILPACMNKACPRIQVSELYDGWKRSDELRNHINYAKKWKVVRRLCAF